MQPEVSVVVPVFRGEAYVAATLRSLQAQEFADFEVLCIDDCSDDGSGEIIRAMAAGDRRIRYVRTEANLGNVPRVLSRYLPEARGRYFAYTSQDDSFSPDWLGSMVEVARDSGAEAVVPDLVFHDEVHGDTRWLRNSDRVPVTGSEAFLLSLDWTIPGNALFHRSLFERFGFFDFGMYADEYSWRFYFLQCRKVAFARGLFRYFQGNPDAITRKLSPGMLDRPGTDYRLWQLVEEHAPHSPWTTRQAQQSFRALRNALALIEVHPELRVEAQRVEEARGLMRNDPAFRRRLRQSYGRGLLGRLSAFGLDHPGALRLVARVNRLRAGRL
nr:glycosyltransferase family 2 protein [uncultured Sphingomonas sp.]